MTKPVIRSTVQLRRTLLAASAVSMTLLIVLLAVTLAGCDKKRVPDNKTVHNGQRVSRVVPLASSSPDNCSGCHS